MVSTPIGAPSSPVRNTHIQHISNPPHETSPSQSSVANPIHSFPVLYTTSPMGANLTTLPTDATPTPISLYSEYMGNPYTLPNNAFSIYGAQPLLVYQNQPSERIESASSNTEIITNTTQFPNTELNQTDANTVHPIATNIFQSSNYFYNDANATNIPVGSEILFGTGNKT